MAPPNEALQTGFVCCCFFVFFLGFFFFFRLFFGSPLRSCKLSRLLLLGMPQSYVIAGWFCVLLDGESLIRADFIPLFVIHVLHSRFPLTGIEKYLT